MDINNALSIATNFIAGEEDFSPSAYYDTNGYAIGYGNHNYMDGSAVQDGDTISQGDAMTLLAFYVQQFYALQVAPKITANLNDNQVAALISVAYNCGSLPSNLVNVINSGAPQSQIDAAFEAACATVKGQPSLTLYKRRLGENSLFDTALQTVVDLYQNNPRAIIGTVVVATGLLAYLVVRIVKRKKS